MKEVTKKGQKLKRRQPNQLTAKQKAFADAILANPNASATSAALKAYDTKEYNTAAALASENLGKPNILAYLQDHAIEAEHTVFDVMLTSKALAEDASHASVALRAASDILDRVHGKAVQKQEISVQSVAISLDLTHQS